MGATVPRDVHEAFRQVCYDFGVEKLAGMMGIPAGTLYNKCNVNETSHHKPTLADCVVVTLLTGDKRIVQAFARTVGGVYFDLPDLSSLSTDALLIALAQVQITNGSFHHEIHDSLSGDDRIDPREYARIERAAHAYLAAILEGLARMREMSGVNE
jgi:hypothetical protein